MKFSEINTCFGKKIKLTGDIFGVHKTLCWESVCVKAVIMAAFVFPVTPWEEALPFTLGSHTENIVLMLDK